MSSITSTYNGTTTSNNTALINEGQIVTYNDLNNIGVRRFVQNSQLYNNLFGDDKYGVINGLKVAERSTDLSGAGVTILSGSIAVTAGAAKLGLITSDLYSSPHTIICKLDANYNDIAIDIGDPDYPRIDLIAIRAREYSTNNTTVAKRTSAGVLTTDVYDIDFGASVDIHYIQGTPNSTPVKPTVNSASTDIELAYIYVPANATDIAECNIIDYRHLLFMNGQSESMKVYGTVNTSGSITFNGYQNNSTIYFPENDTVSGNEIYFNAYYKDTFDDIVAKIQYNTSGKDFDFSGRLEVYVDNDFATIQTHPGQQIVVFWITWVDYASGLNTLPPKTTDFCLELLPIKYD